MAGLSIDSNMQSRGVIRGMGRITQTFERYATTLQKVNTLARAHVAHIRTITSESRRLANTVARRAGPGEMGGTRGQAWGVFGPGVGGPGTGARVGDLHTGAGTSATGARAQLAEMQASSRAFQRLANSSKEYQETTKETAKSNRRQGVSFGQLLGLMIKFGVAMEIIMLPGRLVSAFKGMIDAGIEWEKGLANINALLRVSKSEITDLGRALNRTAVEYGVSGDILAAGYEAASSLTQTLIDDALRLDSTLSKIQGEARATEMLVDMAAKASVAGATDIDIAMEALVRTSSGFGLNFKELEESMDIMFKTVDRGVLSFSDLAQHVGELVAGISMMWGADSRRSLKEFGAVSAGLATMTRTLAPAEAFTSMRNLMRDLGRQSAGGAKLIDRLKELGANLTLDDYIATGFAGTIKELDRTLMPHGTIIDQLVERHGMFASAIEETNYRQARSTEILQKLFPNIRTFRGLQSLLINGGREFATNLKEQRSALGETNKQLKEQQDTVYNVMQSLKALGRRIKFELFLTIRDPLKKSMEMLKEWLQTITDTSAFREAGFFDKFRMLWDGLSSQFWEWWRGGGKTKVTEAVKTVMEDVTKMWAEFSTNAKLIAAATDVGVAIGVAVVEGTTRGLAQHIIGYGYWKDLAPEEMRRRIEGRPSMTAEESARIKYEEGMAKATAYRAHMTELRVIEGKTFSAHSLDRIKKGNPDNIFWDRYENMAVASTHPGTFQPGNITEFDPSQFRKNPYIDPQNPFGGRFGTDVIINIDSGKLYHVGPNLAKQLTDMLEADAPSSAETPKQSSNYVEKVNKNSSAYRAMNPGPNQ